MGAPTIFIQAIYFTRSHGTMAIMKHNKMPFALLFIKLILSIAIVVLGKSLI
jgi:hypothetical protein